MSLYRKIEVRMWGDAKFRPLSDQEKLLWCYLLSGPHTTSIPGVIIAGTAGLAESMGWTHDQLQDRFQTLAKIFSIRSDWQFRLLFIPSSVLHNPPTHPNVVKCWADTFADLPESPLLFGIRDTIIKNLKHLEDSGVVNKGYAELFKTRLPERYQNVMITLSKPSQKQKQKQNKYILPNSKTEPSLATYSAPTSETKTVSVPDPSDGMLPFMAEQISEPAKPKASEIPSGVKSLIEHWQKRHPRKLGPRSAQSKDVRRIQAMLKIFSADELKRAIDGNARSQWHRDKGVHGLEVIFRDESQIRRFLEEAGPDLKPTISRWAMQAVPYGIDGIIADKLAQQANYEPALFEEALRNEITRQSALDRQSAIAR